MTKIQEQLDDAFVKMIDILKGDERCKGGWHYGSRSRNEQDEYSDYDPVFLVADKDFEDFDKDVPSVLSAACDELLIFWAESFNDAHFKNYCSVMRIGENLHQFDLFIINSEYEQDWMCRQHCKGCTVDNIIFDRTGEVAKLLSRGLRTDNYLPDPIRVMDTYWFHTEMLIKYFKRKDIFKLIKNIDVMFKAHVDLLLYHYDTLDWGAWESKVSHCVPIEKQENLKVYFAPATCDDLKKVIAKGMYLFQQDAREICRVRGIEYQESISEQVISFFYRQLLS